MKHLYRIGIIDPCYYSRLGLLHIFDNHKDLSVDFSCATVNDAVMQLSKSHCNILIVDITEPQNNISVEVHDFIKLVSSTYPLMKVIIFSSNQLLLYYYDHQYSHPYILISKKTAIFELPATILTETKYNEIRIKDVLTPREKKVLKMTSYGLSNKEISRELHCSTKVVSSNRINASKKLGLYVNKNKIHPINLLHIFPVLLYELSN